MHSSGACAIVASTSSGPPNVLHAERRPERHLRVHELGELRLLHGENLREPPLEVRGEPREWEREAEEDHHHRAVDLDGVLLALER